ncbi:MAG TPA: succinate dehydrogenase, hydrophobic membrane anchor protein [Allosphingosinicella sp.]|nr:succinate dehydrogenase, hydrophobic membrane anchor protein [Allosphingosinicella sp.]
MTDARTDPAPLPVAAEAAPARAAAAHDEAGADWGHERLLSAATLALFVWLAVSLWRLPAFDQATVTQWLRTPLAAVPMLLLILVTFKHLKLGLIVVVEDYVHEAGSKLVWLVLIKFAAIFAAALAAFCVLKIALGAGAG